LAAKPDSPIPSYSGTLTDLDRVRQVLLIRLRSIGDTVLMTPCITALKRWRPDIEVDVLLEPFCAPVLDAHPSVDAVVRVGRGLSERVRVARALRRRKYDLTVDLNGGTTAALLARASGARACVGFAGYKTAWLATCRVTSSHDVWGRTDVHTVEHQLALVAGIGVPVEAAGPTSLAVDPAAAERVDAQLAAAGLERGGYAVLHPEASEPDKRWPADRFARLAETLAARRGLGSVIIGTDDDTVRRASGATGTAMAGLPLAETLALLEGAALFVGNDSGPAHIAAAFARPSVVIFGPSNVDLWRPWSSGPWRVVREGARAEDASDAAVEAAVDQVLSAAGVERC
jgi:heptosyltransferase-3